jgi:hypothetical protein
MNQSRCVQDRWFTGSAGKTYWKSSDSTRSRNCGRASCRGCGRQVERAERRAKRRGRRRRRRRAQGDTSRRQRGRMGMWEEGTELGGQARADEGRRRPGGGHLYVVSPPLANIQHKRTTARLKRYRMTHERNEHNEHTSVCLRVCVRVCVEVCGSCVCAGVCTHPRHARLLHGLCQRHDARCRVGDTPAQVAGGAAGGVGGGDQTWVGRWGWVRVVSLGSQTRAVSCC